ncbi:MAG: glycosyltransferase family 1 protein [Spirochaetota bacterium]
MYIALLHYHLLRGGVSSVIRHQAALLKQAGYQVLIITGEAPSDLLDIPAAIVPLLAYDSVRAESEASLSETPEALAQGIRDAMQSHWGRVADVLHVHNPLLRKNKLLLPALELLQKGGVNLLLHNHDFAEDFRPDVYNTSQNYPENCHFGVINRRDYSFLHRSGLKKEGLHFLPNAVLPLQASRGLERRRFVYPVRAIRRKNIGEALFLSLFIPKGTSIAITLPPAQTSSDLRCYQFWKQVAVELSLPVEFEVGLRESIADIMGTAQAVLTTSVQEGFGFAFLEPWTVDVAVLGRRIGTVCSDFERDGLQFPYLYDSIDIPMAYLSPPLLRKKLEHILAELYGAYNLELETHTLKTLTDNIFSQEVFDFGKLDEEFQMDIIEMAASNSIARQDIIDINPFLQTLATWDMAAHEDLIQTNKELVALHYSMEHALNQLQMAYTRVTSTPVQHRISKSVLLDLFLDPLKLYPVGITHMGSPFTSSRLRNQSASEAGN